MTDFVKRIWRGLRHEFLWEYEFDGIWRNSNPNFLTEKIADIFSIYSMEFQKKVEEKRLFWRMNGKRLGYSPWGAVYSANLDVLNLIYAEYKDKMRDDSIWIQAAGHLDGILSSARYLGDPTPVDNSTLNGVWTKYGEKHHSEVRERIKKSDEIDKIRFPIEEINTCISEIQSGVICKQARSVWTSLSRYDSDAHLLAKQNNLQLDTVIFWIIVFSKMSLVEGSRLGNGFRRLDEDIDRDQVFEWNLQRIRIADKLWGEDFCTWLSEFEDEVFEYDMCEHFQSDKDIYQYIEKRTLFNVFSRERMAFEAAQSFCEKIDEKRDFISGWSNQRVWIDEL